MASASKAHLSVQRINKAYVQVPTSPLSLASYHPALSAKLKENTPLRPLQFSTKLSMSRKRKRSDPECVRDESISVLKKAKLVTVDGTSSNVKTPRNQPIVPTANACPDLPNGYVYCHQCAQKRDILSEFVF